MATDRVNRQTIIVRSGLLGASAGIVVGLVEAACLRLPSFPLALLRPHVAASFWFFAPLLTSVTLGALGLLGGFLAALPRSRFLGMAIIAGQLGLTGDYLWSFLRSYPSGRVWIIFLQEIITPSLIFALIFGCTFVFLWATGRSGSPLGALDDIPLRPWAVVALGSIAALALSVGISSLSDHLADSTHAMAKSRSPNIVLIVWDTARADHFSSYGYTRDTTPNVDQFSGRGVVFENAISSSNWTLPAMASMFTSLLPHQHGAGADTPFGNGPRTLAEILGLAGYETAGFNANATYGLAPWGLARGFETYVDSSATLGYSLDASRIGHNLIEPYSEEWFHRSRFDQFTAGQLNAQVYHWFNHRSDRPYFLLVHYNDAHDPYEVPSPYDHFYGRMSPMAKSRLPAAKLGRAELSTGERESVIAAYDNALKYLDTQVAELLQFLKRSPGWSNTYVIITADHGEAFGEHHNYTHGWDLHREVLHVPLIVVGPGIPAGVRVSHIARTRQIFPTVLEWAGAKGNPLRRISLAQMWNANYTPNWPDEATLSEVIDATPPPAPQGEISVTTREWQLLCERSHGRYELYHWITDPTEQHDVSELPENRATVEMLKARILSIVERSYRPWRDTRYLLAISGPDFSPDLEAQKLLPPSPGGPLFAQGAGAAQTLFPQNPETPLSVKDHSDEELLRTIPYDGAP